MGGCRALDGAADFGGAGEGDLGDPRVLAERCTGGLANTGHDVEDTGWDPGFQRQFTQPQSCQRGLLGWFKHERVAGGQGRPDLLCCHHQRIIPRRDGSADPDRLAAGVDVEAGRRDGVGLAGQLGRPAGVVAHLPDRHLGFDVVGDAQRFAVVEAFQLGQCFPVSLHQVGEAMQQPFSLGGQQRGPTGLCPLRCGDGGVDIGCAAVGDVT